MVQVTFISPDGVSQDVSAQEGMSLMEAARDAGVGGIVAECGGSCSCSTCHVYVAPEWFDKLDAAEEMEVDLLDFVEEPEDTSRLSCQIKVTAALEGLTVRVPTSQG